MQINSVCGIGSTGRIATDIHKILESNNHESHIAYGRGKSRNCESSIRIGNDFDNYSHVILTRLFDKHGYGSIEATELFIEELKRKDPDVIHLHNIHGYYINIVLLFEYLKKSNKPIIWTFHDCWAFTGHCAYFDYVECEKWKTSCNSCPSISSYPSSLFVDNSEKNHNLKKDLFTGLQNLTIVTPSEWLKKLVKKSFLKDYPVEVINNGIDTGIFQPTNSDFRKKYNISNKFMILGIASTWDERKGFKYFIELAKTLNEDEIIFLVGLTKSQISKLPHNIIGLSKTNSIEDLAKIYSMADVFINPTLEDNFPTTNIESLACGTPVITFNTGGSIESIDNATGIIVEKGNVKMLTKAIKEIKKNGKSHYKNSCVKRANELYRKDDRFYEYLKLYEYSSNKQSEYLLT